MKKVGMIFAAGVLSLVVILVASAQKPGDSLYSYSRLSMEVAFQISSRYVDKIDSKDLIYAGIHGMIDLLDPFSEFLERKDYDKLQEATKGKYSGLGMTIMLKDDYVTIVAPMEGTPAYRMGLRAGDKITKIDGKSAVGMSTQEASSLMRGPAGTKVSLTIEREGVDEPLEYTIERAVIEIKTVPFYSTFKKNGKTIGYVRLARFGEEAHDELEQAFRELLKQHIDGLIFDLRSNGGGLLDQAVKVANYFLPKGTEITSTKGRTEDQDRKLYADADPLIPADIPLVVLVNSMSASASEIVSGSIQDWDRGVLIGDTTFGKGLVQQVYPLSEDVALKLTTAKWYVPSGRCIQKDIRSTRHPEKLKEKEAKADSTKPKEHKLFYTKGGRPVYGGGGIVPDIYMPDEPLNALELNLERLSMFFGFSIKYTVEHPDLPEDFKVTDDLLQEFKAFLKEKDFTYKTELESRLDELKEAADSSGRADEYSNLFAELEKQVELDKEDQFNQSLDYIKRSLKRDILTKLYGEKAVYRQNVLKTDKYVQKAAEVLTSPDEYAGILKP